ncbi:MAG: hypothetical protein ABR557_11465 [Pyrinomonadaceae bacterium]
MANTNDFDATFLALKEVLKPYERGLVVQDNSENNYCLVTKHIMKNKQPLWFAGVRRGKAYVSYHLIPIYACPELAKGMSADLKKRMQGKSCFNFKKVDAKLFKELAKLTKAGLKRFSDQKFIQKISI